MATSVREVTSNPKLIQAQTEKAIALWDKCTKKGVPEDVRDNVCSRLKVGKVPPIFHAYCAPSKRLFDSEKMLSPEKVVVGQADPGSIGELSMDDKPRYDDDFFAGPGVAHEIVWDEYLQDEWTFDPDWTETVASLVNAEADMVGMDVEVTRLPGVPFPIDKGPSQYLITRPLSRGVVADCFGLTKTRKNQYAIVGTPGIGKSWTLIYALQQALLYDDVCVVICFQKDDVALACIRQRNTVYVWKTLPPIPFFSCLFEDSNILVLLDPFDVIDGGAKFGGGNNRVIFAACSNYIHFKNAIEKRNAAFQRFLSPCTYDEPQVALPYMMQLTTGNKDEKVLDALKRADKVGMLPRYVLSQSDCEQHLKAFYTGVHNVKYDFKGLVALLESDGYGTQSNTLPGIVYAISAAGTITKDRRLEQVGYDGEEVRDYGCISVDFVSKLVVNHLAITNRKAILSIINDTKELSGLYRHLVEEMFWSDLTTAKRMDVIRLMPKSTEENRKGKLVLSDRVDAEENVKFDDLATVLSSKQVCRMEPIGASIDFAGPGRKVYLIRGIARHDFKPEWVAKLLSQGGYLKITGTTKDNTVYTIVPKSAAPEKLQFYWTTPMGIKKSWRKWVPKTFRAEGDPAMEVLNDCLERHVEQFVILMK